MNTNEVGSVAAQGCLAVTINLMMCLFAGTIVWGVTGSVLAGFLYGFVGFAINIAAGIFTPGPIIVVSIGWPIVVIVGAINWLSKRGQGGQDA